MAIFFLNLNGIGKMWCTFFQNSISFVILRQDDFSENVSEC